MKKILAASASLLTALIAVLAFAAKMNVRGVALRFIRPEAPFTEPAVPPAPDYGLERFWAALPGARDEADLVPARDGTDNQGAAPADAFYIHPTGYYSGANWNSPLDPASRAAPLTRLMLAGQASAFNGCCKVYAPRYREATLYSFIDRGGSGRKALDVAYSDVARAFDYYIFHFNKNRPFIIASHSQGSVHAIRLLEEKIDGTPLVKRFVAAYVIGIQVPMDKFRRSYRTIRPCANAADTGCVVSWNTYETGSVPERIVPTWYRTGWESTKGKDILCTNPLTWRIDGGPAPANLNLGAVRVPLEGTLRALFTGRTADVRVASLPEPIAGLTGARCADGFLFVPPLERPFRSRRGGSYHVYDYSLFYMNIRENAIERVAAFMRGK